MDQSTAESAVPRMQTADTQLNGLRCSTLGNTIFLTLRKVQDTHDLLLSFYNPLNFPSLQGAISSSFEVQFANRSEALYWS